jgi:hypothetical protein
MPSSLHVDLPCGFVKKVYLSRSGRTSFYDWKCSTYKGIILKKAYESQLQTELTECKTVQMFNKVGDQQKLSKFLVDVCTGTCSI